MRSWTSASSASTGVVVALRSASVADRSTTGAGVKAMATVLDHTCRRGRSEPSAPSRKVSRPLSQVNCKAQARTRGYSGEEARKGCGAQSAERSGSCLSNGCPGCPSPPQPRSVHPWPPQGLLPTMTRGRPELPQPKWHKAAGDLSQNGYLSSCLALSLPEPNGAPQLSSGDTTSS